MYNIIIYNVLCYIYLLCTLFYAGHIFFRKNTLGKAATALTFFALIVHTAAFIIRWVESHQLGIGHLPIRGPYECLTFSAGIIILFYLGIERSIRTRAFGVVILPLATLMMIFAALSSEIDHAIYPMPEVLQGNYINYHLSACFVGYGAFTVSCVASIMFLAIQQGIISPANILKRLYLARETLDDISYKMIAVGFIMFSIMIVTGMFRSKIIWGRYWEWDPVQTWSFLAWVVYAVILHGRYTWRWSGGLTAVLSIVGFILSIISFLIGAGFLSSSMHFPITG